MTAPKSMAAGTVMTGDPTGATPVPVRGITRDGWLTALLDTVRLPLLAPEVPGAKPILTWRNAPAATVKLVGGKTLNGKPLEVIADTTRSALPVLLRVNC